MKLDLFYNEATKIWKRLSESADSVNVLLQLELDIHKKLLIFFQIGESCYLIFDFQRVAFDFVSEDVATFLGYERHDFSADQLMQNIHPDDRSWFLNCQETAGAFLFNLCPERQMKYKIRIDYRMQKQTGEYIRVMHQAVVIQNDDSGKIIRCLIVLTDITHLKKNGKPVMSYIGMDGEPSYLDVDVKN
ncbi:MAG: PAS domain-containing protein, partial [Mucilaginibacter sp.]